MIHSECVSAVSFHAAKVMNQVKTQRDASIDGVNININADKTTSHEVRRRPRVMNGNNRRGKRVSHLLCSYLLCICLVCIPACLLSYTNAVKTNINVYELRKLMSFFIIIII
eukprot:88019_1